MRYDWTVAFTVFEAFINNQPIHSSSILQIYFIAPGLLFQVCSKVMNDSDEASQFIKVACKRAPAFHTYIQSQFDM